MIAIAQRGHGKSEIAKQPLSYKRFVEDIYQVIRAVINDSATVIGFSYVGYIAYILNADHPEVVERVVAIGAGSLGAKKRTEEVLASFRNMNGAELEKQMASFVNSLEKLMPQPERLLLGCKPQLMYELIYPLLLD